MFYKLVVPYPLLKLLSADEDVVHAINLPFPHGPVMYI